MGKLEEAKKVRALKTVLVKSLGGIFSFGSREERSSEDMRLRALTTPIKKEGEFEKTMGLLRKSGTNRLWTFGIWTPTNCNKKNLKANQRTFLLNRTPRKNPWLGGQRELKDTHIKNIWRTGRGPGKEQRSLLKHLALPGRGGANLTFRKCVTNQKNRGRRLDSSPTAFQRKKVLEVFQRHAKKKDTAHTFPNVSSKRTTPQGNRATKRKK